MYPAEETKEEDEEELTLEQKQERVIRETLRQLACKMTCVVITQPLHVMALRAIAEFVGSENKYSGGLTLGLYNGAVNILQVTLTNQRIVSSLLTNHRAVLFCFIKINQSQSSNQSVSSQSKLCFM